VSRTAAPGAWDEFWRRTAEPSAHAAGGPQDEALAGFWSAFLDAALSGPGPLRVLDVACGNGALARAIVEAAGRAGGPAPQVTGLDHSPAALADLRRRLPSVRVVAGDAALLPLQGAAFDVVVSQFGLEYGGMAAFAEAARVVAPGGVLGAVVHLRGGPIHRECEANLAAIERVRQSGVLPDASACVAAGRALATGKGGRAAFRAAGDRLAGSLGSVAALLAGVGPRTAGGAIRRLHGDLAAIARRPESFDAAEVAAWAGSMAAELQAYAGRMASMAAAAVDEGGVTSIESTLARTGLAVRRRGVLLMGVGRPEPGAWTLLCDRPPPA
jgi:SAM-dependent methyltransferase